MALGKDDVLITSINTQPGVISVTPSLGNTAPIALKDSLSTQVGVANRH